MGLSERELKGKPSVGVLVDNGLGSMLQYCFGNSPYEAINATYPDRFKKSNFKEYNARNKL